MKNKSHIILSPESVRMDAECSLNSSPLQRKLKLVSWLSRVTVETKSDDHSFFSATAWLGTVQVVFGLVDFGRNVGGATCQQQE